MSIKKRIAIFTRETKETKITIKLNLDGTGKSAIETSVDFLNHMLSQVAKHGRFDLEIKAKGDDIHHITEDVGICLGEVFNKALLSKAGIVRYGSAMIPMDEALACAVLDISGRPFLNFGLKIKQKRIGSFDTELVQEFLRAFATYGKLTLHIYQISGKNTHHLIEASFKALGVAIKNAVQIYKNSKDIPSTKGKL